MSRQNIRIVERQSCSTLVSIHKEKVDYFVSLLKFIYTNIYAYRGEEIPPQCIQSIKLNL